jgi:hypothetical protein
MLDLESAIRSRAYEIWQAEGQVHGRDVTHWLRAEEEIKGRATSGSNQKAALRKPAAKPAAARPAKAVDRKPAKSKA